MIYRIFVLILMGEMLPTNTPSTLAELEGTRSEIYILYCRHYLPEIYFLIIEHKWQSLLPTRSHLNVTSFNLCELESATCV